MKKYKIGVRTLAVSLITLGIILLSRNLTDLNISFIFSAFWPSVIIIFGLEIIIGKLVVRRKKEATRMVVDSLSVVILIIIVVISYLATTINNIPTRINGSSIFGDNSWFYPYKSEYSLSHEFEASNINKIHIDNSHGNVEFKKTSGDKVIVNAYLKFDHNNEDKAEEISKKIVQVDETMSILRIKTLVKDLINIDNIGNLEVSYLIKIPNEIDVDIVNNFGDISIEGNVKHAEISSKHSNVSVKGVEGSIVVDNSFGYVNIEDGVGPVKVCNKHGSINVNYIVNDILIENSYDKVNVQNISSDVEIINAHDSIYVKNVTGDIDVRGSYSDVIIEGASQGIKITNKHGNIRFIAGKIVKKYVHIKNEYGDVRIIIPGDQEGNYNVNVKYGDIYNDFGIRINENSNEQNMFATIGNSDVKFDLETTHGNLYLNRE